jgi:hypothetical protein
MAYTRRTWVPEQTALSAENMNNIEDGIVEAKAAANGNEIMWIYIRNRISSVLGLTAEQYNGNAATVNSHTVDANVPANAVFTDTTYSDATTSERGLMSANDKSRLNAAVTNVAVSDAGITRTVSATATEKSITIGLDQKVIERTITGLAAGSTHTFNVTAAVLGITSEDMVAKWTIDSVMYQSDTDIWYTNTNDSVHCSATIYGPNASTAVKNCVSIFLKNNTSASRNVKVRVVMRNIGTTRV